MLFSLKSYAKKCFTVWRNYFLIKSYSTFLPKCSKLHHSEMYTIWYAVYLIMVETVEKKKKDKTWRNEVDTETVNRVSANFFFTISRFSRFFSLFLAAFQGFLL